MQVSLALPAKSSRSTDESILHFECGAKETLRHRWFLHVAKDQNFSGTAIQQSNMNALSSRGSIHSGVCTGALDAA
jgi:hypothetical protein